MNLCSLHMWEADDQLLHLVRNGCKSKVADNETDWYMIGLIEMMRTKCVQQRVETWNMKKFHPKCIICKDVIKDIKEKIENSPAEKDIMYRLESLCDALPNKDKCVNFVEAYTEKIVNMILNDISEESICAEIGYC